MTTLVSTREQPAHEARDPENLGSAGELPVVVAKLVQAAGWGALGPDAWTHNLNSPHTANDRCSPHRGRRPVSPRGARSAGRSTGRLPDHALLVRGSAR